MILLFTDFGPSGPYTGQMQAVLARLTPTTTVLPLLSDAPTADPVSSAYLLAALCKGFPAGTIFLSVIDPGVGSTRKPVVLSADGQYFVGPDNGLFNTVAVMAENPVWREIIWRPEHCSNSFHGRDLFAPVAAALAENRAECMLSDYDQGSLINWPRDIKKIIYIDHYGNAMTGLRYDFRYQGQLLKAGNKMISQASTFSDVEHGEAFWYDNSCGLIEVAVNKGRADTGLGLQIGTGFDLLSS